MAVAFKKAACLKFLIWFSFSVEPQFSSALWYSFQIFATARRQQLRFLAMALKFTFLWLFLLCQSNNDKRTSVFFFLTKFSFRPFKVVHGCFCGSWKIFFHFFFEKAKTQNFSRFCKKSLAFINAFFYIHYIQRLLEYRVFHS